MFVLELLFYNFLELCYRTNQTHSRTDFHYVSVLEIFKNIFRTNQEPVSSTNVLIIF